MFLNNVSKIIKTPNDRFKFVLYVSDVTECTNISNGILKVEQEILAHGDTINITEDVCKFLLPEPKFINNLVTNSMSNSYKCWCSEDLGIDQSIAHNSAKSSWQCLMNTLANPEYIVILKEPI